MQKKELPYFDGEPQSRSNFRAMLRAHNALINDNEPLPYRGIWPLISREESDKSYAKFLNPTQTRQEPDKKEPQSVSNLLSSVFGKQELIIDEPPITDYSFYDEDLSDTIIDL